MMKAFERAILVYAGVAAVFMGLAVPGPVRANVTTGTVMTTDSAAMKGLPDYLVNSSTHLPGEVVAMVRRGELSKAIERLEKEKIVHSSTPKIKAYEWEAHRLKALKRDFSATAEDMLRKIREQVKDATAEDVDRWTAENALLWIPVDGKPGYFRREPGILLRTNAEAKGRAQAVKASTDEDTEVTSHFVKALATAKDKGTSLVLPVRYTVTHTIDLKPGHVPAGEVVRCWMPYPREDVPQQSNVKLISMEPQGKIASDKETVQRTAYMEQKAGADGSAKFVMKFQYDFSALVPDYSGKHDGPQDPGPVTYGKGHVSAKSPMDAKYAALAKEIVGSETDAVEKARKIWRWIDKNVRWVPEMEYLVMTDIAQKVLEAKRGDCGTQAILFARLCTAAGVDARWQSGWTMQPGQWNMHDWAEFFAPGLGWLPADPSRGSYDHADPAVREFMFGNIDSYRMVANSDFTEGAEASSVFVPAKDHFRSDPVDNQRGELEWKGGNLFYDSWDYKVDVEQAPAE